MWMLTWLVATASATAMAWWAVTFVTVEVADRRPLRPSDVVAASVFPVVPAPPRADGSPVVGPPPGGAAGAESPAGAANPASEKDGGGGTPPQSISTPVAGADRSSAPSPARLVARWSATPNSSQGPTASVAAAASEVTVALRPQAPPAPPAPAAHVPPRRRAPISTRRRPLPPSPPPPRRRHPVDGRRGLIRPRPWPWPRPEPPAGD